MENEKNKKTRGYTLMILILVIVCGFLAGIGGEIFTKAYLSNFSFFRDLYFTEQANLGQKEIIINEPRKVVVEQDQGLNQTKNVIQSSVVSVFKQKSAPKNPLDSLFLPSDYLGSAIILTSDGWLISTQDVIFYSRGSLVVNYNKKNYDVEKIVKDDLSPIVFIKIKAQNLPVLKFADFRNALNGQQIFAYNSYLDHVVLANIQNLRYKEINNKYDLVSSTQVLDKDILLNKNFGPDFKGAPIFNFQGEVIGLMIVKDDILDQAIPIHYLDPIINQVLKGEKIKRPDLGINYLNLSQVYGLAEDVRQGQELGALIWPDQSGFAILPSSPLYNKLKAGDIITEIENQKIDQNNDLLDILLDYKSGQQISLKYLREQKESELSIVLK